MLSSAAHLSSARGAQLQQRVPAGPADRCRLHERRRRPFLPRASGSAEPAEQLSMIATRLSSVRCRELLTASLVECLKAGLVGSSTQPASGGSGNGGSTSPEAALESLHADLQAWLQDSAHTIAAEHQEAWAETQWEAFQAAHTMVHSLLLEAQAQAAAAGSAAGALQAARCLEQGHLVPQDAGRAFREYERAAALGSAEAAVWCGTRLFQGTAPSGRDTQMAFAYFSQALAALDQASADAAPALPPLAAQPPDAVSDGDLPQPLSVDDVRQRALTGMGRCYLEGAGVERNVRQAITCFQEAGDEEALKEVAVLLQQCASLEKDQSH